MLVNKNVVENNLQHKFWNISIDTELQIKMYKYAKDNYNMSEELFSDFVSSRKSLQEATEYMLFVMLKSFECVNNVKKSEIKTYFTPKEIENYSCTKFEDEGPEFPIIFKMVQITEDQWIGRIDVNTFDKLRQKQLINYNPDTQRTMQKVIRKGNINYKITVNKRAVNEIAESFTEGTYIPDELTLNINPNDPNADFYYDEKKCLLIINNITAFDINDGYHRYLGMFKAKMQNSKFNYSMELRITNFDTDKSQRFIYQKDQKTQMSKMDSKSYNVYDAANIIIKKVNESPVCNIRGFIGRNDAKIDMGSLSKIISLAYLKDVSKKDERKAIIEISKKLIDNFNILTEDDISYLDRTYTFNDLVAIITVFHYYDENNKDKCNMAKAVNYLVSEVQKPDNVANYGKYSISRRRIQGLEKKLKEGEIYYV